MMALITCKECNNQVSDTAEKCPSCGAKVPKKLSAIHWVGIVILGFIVIGIFSGGENSKSGSTASVAAATEAAIEVSSVSLAREYDQNEARADAQFKDKILKVSGTVTGINKDVTDSTVIMLNGVNEFLGVHAEVDKSEEQKAINLSKGQKVTVQCRGKGEIISSPMLGDCVIL